MRSVNMERSNRDSKQYSQMCVENNFHIENENENKNKPKFAHKELHKEMCFENRCYIEDELRHDGSYRDSQSIRRRKVAREGNFFSDTIRKKLQKDNHKTEKYLISTGAMAGLLDTAASTSVGIYTSESYNPPLPSDKYSHVLQKDTPINKMVFFSAHNMGALAGHGTMTFWANQTMGIKEMLDNTPIRAFDFDIFEHNGELVLLHGPLDHTVKDADITRFKDVLNDINDWLKQNPEEVLIFNIEYHGLYYKSMALMDSIFGKKYTEGIEDLILGNNYTAPTIRELTQNDIQVLVPTSYYESAGDAHLTFSDNIDGLCYEFQSYGKAHGWFTQKELENGLYSVADCDRIADKIRKQLEIHNVWEDRTVDQFLYKIHPEVAGKLSVEDVDKIIASNKGCIISLDHITSNDPRFFKPEDRETFNLTHDMEIANQSVHGEITDSFITGIGVFTAGASIALSTIISTLHFYTNEMQIRKQSKVAPKELSKIEIGEILIARSKKNKENSGIEEELLISPITVDELKKIYKKNQILKIIKTTSLPGASATTSISASILSLGLVFPPLTLALSSLSVAVGSIGIASTLVSTALNVYRLHQAIDEACELPHVQSAFQNRVDSMNQEINNKIENAGLSDPTDLKPIFDKFIQDNETTTKLVAASTTATATGLIFRITGVAKYSLPIMGSISAGVCAVASIFLTSILSTINFKERRKNLENISAAVLKQVMPNHTKKSKLKLGIFGQTAIERFVEKDHKNLLQLLNLPEETSFKDAFSKLMLPQNSMILDKYVELFSFEEWNKELIKTAKDVYPTQDFSTIRQNKRKLNNVFKQYMQNQIKTFASRNTWITGIIGAISIISVGYFSGMLFLPLIGIFFPVVGIPAAGTTIKLTAMREAKLFVTRFKHIINSNSNDLNKEDLRHRKQFDSLLLKWEKLFYQPDDTYMVTRL